MTADEEDWRYFIATHSMFCGQGFFLLPDRIECGRDECRAVWIYRKAKEPRR